MIVPEFEMEPLLTIPVTNDVNITSVVPDGITSSSPTAMLPPVVIVHLFWLLAHAPPSVGQEEAFSVMVVACASWIAKADNEIKTTRIER